MEERHARPGSTAWPRLNAVVLALSLGAIATAAAAQDRPERRIAIGTLVTAVAFSPDGTHLLAWDPRGFSRWDVDSGRQRGREAVFAKACGRAPALPRSEDGRTIGVNCEGRLHFFDLATGKPLGDWQIPPKQNAALYTASPGGRVAAIVMAGATDVVDVRDLSGPGRDVSVTIDAEVSDLSVAPGATRLAVGTVRGVGVRHLPNGNLIRAIDGGPAHALSADGRTLAVVAGGGARIFEIEEGRVLREVEGRVSHLRFGASDRLLTGWSNQSVFVWDALSGERRISLSTEEFVSAAVAEDGARLATVSLERRGGGASSVVAIWTLPK